MELRKFSREGLERFRTFLDHAKQGDTRGFPSEILKSPKWTDYVPGGIKLSQKLYSKKEDLIRELATELQKLDAIPFYDQMLWTWLAAFYFDSICPVIKGERKVREEARYILNSEHWGRYYRHLIAAPTRLYIELGEDSKIYLAGSPDKHGDLMEQLGSRQQIATSRGIIQAATNLYWDSEKETIKKGARNKTGPGVLRRFTGDIIPQFEMTYDLNAMDGSEVLELLPAEFNEWKN